MPWLDLEVAKVEQNPHPHWFVAAPDLHPQLGAECFPI